VPPGLGPLIDLLRVLLKTRCDQHEVAQKLLATSSDLELIAADDDAKVPGLAGWRREIFGAEALNLKHGKLALTAAASASRSSRSDPWRTRRHHRASLLRSIPRIVSRPSPDRRGCAPHSRRGAPPLRRARRVVAG